MGEVLGTMSERRYMRRFYVWYYSDEGRSVFRTVARSSLEAGLNFINERPGVEMDYIDDTGRAKPTFPLVQRRQFV